MPLFRAALAVSLDGYIADAAGGAKWLDPYFSPEFDFAGFMATIGIAVIGRKTYDQAMAMGRGDGRAVVLTHRPLAKQRAGLEAFAGDLRALAARLRQETDKDIWLMGGGESLRAFHAADLVDRWELAVMPVLLGQGIPLFPRHPDGLSSLRLVECKSYSNGVVGLHYERAAKAAKTGKTGKATKAAKIASPAKTAQGASPRRRARKPS